MHYSKIFLNSKWSIRKYTVKEKHKPIFPQGYMCLPPLANSQELEASQEEKAYISSSILTRLKLMFIP